jgi:hypothetical protein
MLGVPRMAEVMLLSFQALRRETSSRQKSAASSDGRLTAMRRSRLPECRDGAGYPRLMSTVFGVAASA